jgi:hypothetical protein
MNAARLHLSLPSPAPGFILGGRRARAPRGERIVCKMRALCRTRNLTWRALNLSSIRRQAPVCSISKSTGPVVVFLGSECVSPWSGKKKSVRSTNRSEEGTPVLQVSEIRDPRTQTRFRVRNSLRPSLRVRCGRSVHSRFSEFERFERVDSSCFVRTRVRSTVSA